MNQKPTEFAGRYARALRQHLKQGAAGSLSPATRLGRQAVASGLRMPGLARLHADALSALKASEGSSGSTKEARRFLAEVTASIGATRAARRQSTAQARGLRAKLSRCTLDLAAVNLRLRQASQGRERDAASNPQSSTGDSEVRLPSSEDLRRLTHRLLSAQEKDRRSVGEELQNEIAQALLGVQAALIAVQGNARGNAETLKRGLASTARMVVNSTRSMSRLARARATT